MLRLWLKKHLGFIMLFYMLVSLFGGIVHTEKASASSQPVKLMDATVWRDWEVGYHTFTGDIEVENIAYNKQVSVVYSLKGTNVWYEAPAHYVSHSEGNYEVWRFGITFEDDIWAKGIQFAIKYTVNGTTYWDNNGGAGVDYRNCGSNPCTVFPQSSLKHEKFSFSMESLSGRVIVKNIDPTKEVKVVYTTDDWATVKVKDAHFSGFVPDSNNALEYWNWYIDTPSGEDGIFKVKWAYMYSVNGFTYWDRNLGSNYVAIKDR